jgi:hypothetical protein
VIDGGFISDGEDVKSAGDKIDVDDADTADACTADNDGIDGDVAEPPTTESSLRTLTDNILFLSES